MFEFLFLCFLTETISANDKTVTCVMDAETGQIQFSVMMRGFEFKKALMQVHFNENDIERVAQDVTADGSITVQQDIFKAAVALNILLSDYKISIPSIIRNNLSNTVNIAVNCSMQPLQ